MIARIALYIFASLLVAAHFLHIGSTVGVALALLAPALFLVRERWSLLLLQWLAYGAAAIWLVTAWQLVSLRWSVGRPWLLAAAILTAVAAVSVLAGGLLRGRTAQSSYRER